MTIPAAMMMDEIVPDSIRKKFELTDEYKSVKINGTSYMLCKYVSYDKKSQTYLLHDADDNLLNNPELNAQSEISIGKIEKFDGKEHKIYANDVILDIPNTDKEVDGYSTDKLDANYKKVAKQMLEYAGITNNQQQEYALNYLDEITESYYLTRHDKDKGTIAEIREAYKDKSADDVIKSAQDKYAEGRKQMVEKEESNVMPYLQKAPNLNRGNKNDNTLVLTANDFARQK